MLIPTDTIVLFVSSSVFLILAPGPDLIFTFTQGLVGGKKAGIVTALGFAIGNAVHTLLVAAGVSALISTSEIAFSVMKYCGAAYLFFLAYKSFIHRKDIINTDLPENNEKNAVKGLFMKAFMMNILNPKVIIFFIAFFPQFIDLKGEQAFFQTLTLGFLFICMTAVIFSLIGYFSGKLRRFLDFHPKIPQFINIGASGVFLLIGIRIATYAF